MQNLSVPLVLTFRKEFDRNILGRWKESFQVDFRTYATSFFRKKMFQNSGISLLLLQKEWKRVLLNDLCINILYEEFKEYKSINNRIKLWGYVAMI